MTRRAIGRDVGSLLCAAACAAAACGGGGPGGGDDDGPGGGSAPLVINELMARDRFSLPAGDASGAPDWIELYNPTDEDVSLEGWSLSDDPTAPDRSPLSGDLVVPAGGYLLLFADARPEAGPDHLSFDLATDGEELVLIDPDGSTADDVRYAAQATDLSAARTPDGSDLWRVVWDISPGAANPDGDGTVGPVDGREEIPAAGDLSEELLGDGALVEIGLELSDDAIASLRAEPRVYVSGALLFRGRRLEPVGVRLKGQNSFEPIDQKPSLRIKLDKYVGGGELFGLDDLVLDNMHSDPTMLHERMAYRIARLAGVPASRCAYAFVTINDQPYGLYADLENVDSRFLGRNYPDATGSLFESPGTIDVDFRTEPEDMIPLYQLETGPDDRSVLYGLAAALTAPTFPARWQAATMIDRDEFITHWAAMAVAGQFDSWPYTYDDYHVYVDPQRGLSFIPWGMDETFVKTDYWPLAGESLLPDACQKDDACLQLVVDEIWRVVKVTEDAGLVDELDRVREQIAPWIAMDPRRPYTDGEVDAAQDAMRAFVAGRRTYLEGAIPPPSG